MYFSLSVLSFFLVYLNYLVPYCRVLLLFFPPLSCQLSGEGVLVT